MSPAVALESTVITHGLPYPQNVEIALRLEAVIRAEGAEPRTIGIRGGKLISQLSEDDIRYLATAKDVRKVSRRDLPIVFARKLDGATTVAATMWMALRYGIELFATGGIGGVHRGNPMDVSADLEELGRTPVTVVCAGAKALLDVPATLEVLETKGVTVIGYQTDEFPLFYSRQSGLPVDVRCNTPEEVAQLILARQNLSLSCGTLVAVPVPEVYDIPRAAIEPAITQALAEAEVRGLRSAAVTPFLLARLAQITNGRTVQTNRALLENNARVAAQIARALYPEQHIRV